jgi:hypothetical protein
VARTDDGSGDIQEVLDGLNLTREPLIEIGILVGTNFNREL